MEQNKIINSIDTQPVQNLSWGQLSWLVGAEEMPGAEQTFGVVKIHPNQRNPLHSHPNCEELLYVVSGECDHKLGDEILHLTPGSVIRIPRGIKHWAKCTSAEPLVAIISFSSPHRRVDTFEGDEAA